MNNTISRSYKKLVFIFTITFCLPLLTQAEAVLFGEISDRHVGDTISISWDLKIGLTEDDRLNLFLVERNTGGETLVDLSKKRTDSSKIQIPTSIIKGNEYRLELREINAQKTLQGYTSWFTSLGEYEITTIQDDESYKTYYKDQWYDDRISKFSASRIENAIELEWRLYEGTESIIWVECEETITITKTEDNESVTCIGEEKRQFLHQDDDRSGTITLTPVENITEKTKVSFEIVAIENGAFIDSEKISTYFYPVSVSNPKEINETKNTVSAEKTDEARLKEILELTELLDIKVNVELIRLLIVLDLL